MVMTVNQSSIDQFSANIHMLLEQKASIFRSVVQVEMANGERHFFERLGGATAEEVTSSYAASSRQDIEHSRRMAIVRRYKSSTYLDDLDKFKLLIDPKGAHSIRVASALGRKFDEVVIDALLGTAYGGKDGNTATALPAGQKIAHGSVGLTIEKLITARKKFAEKEFFDGNLIMAIRPDALEDLLLEPEIQSADYNTVKALQKGEVETFMGFKFVLSNLVPAGKAIAFADNAVKVAMSHDVMVKSGEDMTHNWSWVIDAYQMYGAVRLEDELVIEVSYA